MNTPTGFFTPYIQPLFASLSLSHGLSDRDTSVVKMVGEISWFEGRLRRRATYRGEVTMEETRSRQGASRGRRRRRKKVHHDLHVGFNAEERTDHAVPAMEVQRRELTNEEENERDDDAVATMVAENQQVEKREKGQTVEGKMSSMQVDEHEKQKEYVKDTGEESEDKQDVKESGDTQAVSEMSQEENQFTDQEVGGVIQEESDQENGGKIVMIYYKENQVEIETIDQENHAADNQEAKESNPVDNREVIVISDEGDDKQVIVMLKRRIKQTIKKGMGLIKWRIKTIKG